MYIYQHKNWPNFVWKQENIADVLIQLSHRQGQLIGAMESISFQIREETVLKNLNTRCC